MYANFNLDKSHYDSDMDLIKLQYQYLLYTYKWYIFWTVCFLAIWYRKPDQRTQVFWLKRRLPIFVATLCKTDFKHGTRDEKHDDVMSRNLM